MIDAQFILIKEKRNVQLEGKKNFHYLLKSSTPCVSEYDDIVTKSGNVRTQV